MEENQEERPAPKRLFFAIGIPGKLASKLARLESEVPELKGRRLRNLHVTIRFLGDTDPGLIPWLLDGAREAASRVPAFPVTLLGLGVFRERPPTPLFLRIAEPLGPILSLRGALDQSLSGIQGLRPDDAPLIPHVTLTRLRKRFSGKLKVLLAQGGDAAHGGFEAESLTLFDSFLGPKGAKHTPIGVFPLGRPSK
ncbi:MAG: RNA 2',3'-cyclic phosphodiesterase [Deltaproteobacteria bacterium]|jgi:2'-5' RNA ligase|nr:RNA 2',3'-cyclic phosphodiesterase [Deltaproteobacteria bacterium]